MKQVNNWTHLSATSHIKTQESILQTTDTKSIKEQIQFTEHL